MEQRRNNYTVIGSVFNTISSWLGILSYIGVPAAVLLAVLKRYSWTIIILSSLIVLWIAIRLCRKNQENIIKFILRLFAPNATYCYSKWEAIYEYKSLDNMSFHTRYWVKALQTGVDHIRVRFNWSGATDSNPIHPKPAKSGGCTTQRIDFVGDEYGYKYYNVYNRTSFNKGDPEIKLGIDIENMRVTSRRAVSHHLLTSVNVVTDLLHMKVILPSNIYPTSVVAHEYLHATDDNHWRDHSCKCQPMRQDDGRWVLSWVIDNPVFGGKYILYWTPEST